MPIRKRLLGFAFASSDLLIELDADRRVALALGSGPSPEVACAALQGQPLADMVVAADLPVLNQALTGLRPGARIGPIPVQLKAGPGRARPVAFSAFSLPELAPAVSCSISWLGEAVDVAPPSETPILDPGAFLAQARSLMMDRVAPAGLAVDFIKVGGLAEQTDAALRAAIRVEAALQSASINGESAAKLAPERYAVLRDSSDGRDLVGEVTRLGQEEGLQLSVSSDAADLADVPPLNALRALRLAAEDCLRDGGLGQTGAAFNDALARTVREAESFRTMVRDRAFEVHYQPIVSLKTGAVHHFEALSRFRSVEGPAGAIRMAEEMALIESFDLVVLDKVVRRLRQPGSGLLKIAVNVSGASLVDDAYVNALLRMTAETPELRRRLMVEVTESAALADIDAANRRLSALREAGIKLCIDDFGSGAASFDYVRKLQVDTVKIDGGLIQGLEQDKRARTMISHLVELCGSLGLTTVAEMVETQGAADILRDLGVDFGQGWLFGKAEAEPRTVLPPSGPVAARRTGAVEAWG